MNTDYPTTITATLPTEEINHGRNLDGDKTLLRAYVLVSGNRELARVKCWSGKSPNTSTVYATIWVHYCSGKLAGCSGYGTARGGGYHMPSAAIGAAIASAGITLSEPIFGRGNDAIREALYAIGVALGYDADAMCVIDV